ncbi:Uncharacterised protein [Burkholderia pseudomallei]|nr:Uncharacterised protein [Burkholderia pseudomallei]CAJ6708652.1 Uncharacterised protein [Burkholderia pseudomallei]
MPEINNTPKDDDINGDSNSLIRSIMTLLEMDAAGVLGPHGVSDHARKLLGAAATRLAAMPSLEPGPKQPRQLVAQSVVPLDERAALTCGDTCKCRRLRDWDGHSHHPLCDRGQDGIQVIVASADETEADGALREALSHARAALYAIANTYDDGELRTRALEAYEKECELPAPAHVQSAGMGSFPDEATFQRLFSKHGGPVSGEGWCINESGLRDFLRELVAQASFQQRVQPWMLTCFGAEISADVPERNHRFFEESGELVQSRGMTREEAHALVDYTWSRPVGEPTQEVGGVMVTLAALCLANGLDMHAAGERELARVNEPSMIDRIRAKQATKPKHSPLPGAAPRIGSHGSDA